MAGFFGMFDYSKPGKGISKEDVDKKGINLYFDIFFRRFWKIIGLNLIYIVFSIPAIVISWTVCTYAVMWLAAAAGLAATEEIVNGMSILSVLVTIVHLHITGSGPASAGLTYVLRKYVNDTHSWVWSDFIENVKTNFRQGMAVYLINLLSTTVCAVGIVFYSRAIEGPLSYIFSALMIIITLALILMQIYTYQLMVSFELSVRSIYKNAFILLMAKLPWNVLIAAITAFVIYSVFSVSMTVPVAGIVIVSAVFYSFINFTQIFMSNNIIKKYVLEPALAAAQEKEEPDSEENIGG